MFPGINKRPHTAIHIHSNFFISLFFTQLEKSAKDTNIIHTFLFEKDLSEIIGLESKKEFILDFYKTITKRISILYHNDKNLKINDRINGYLAYTNYKITKKPVELLKLKSIMKMSVYVLFSGTENYQSQEEGGGRCLNICPI